MDRVRAWLALFRPHNAALAGAGVWLGYASLRSPRPDPALAFWGCLAMLLLTAAGNADNDACDLEADRINHPDRPLPSGSLKSGPARFAAFLLYALGAAAALLVSPLHGALALGMAAMLLLYNRRLKGMPLLGNLAVSLLCALAIYFPEFPSLPVFTLPACLFALLATLARELVKDLEDLEGDNAAGLRTFPVVAGISKTRKLAFALTAVVLALMPLPTAYLGYGPGYAVLSLLSAAPLLLLLLRDMFRPNPDYGRCRRRFKWLMLAGMAALTAGMI